MSILTIFLFIVYTLGLGFTLTNICKLKTKDIYEKIVMSIAIGLCTITLLIPLFSFIRVPIDWRIYLALSLIYPLFTLYRFKALQGYIKSEDFRQRMKPNLVLAMLALIFLFTFLMYYKGAFSYPYLEDDDPWDHAISIKYISTEKTAFDPNVPGFRFSYLDARPPGYDGTLALLHQTSDSLMWTMKFFNLIFISLGILFFFYFARVFFHGNDTKAILATFFLAVFPTYLTHFIWSHALIITLIIVGLYFLFKVDDWKGGLILAIISSASIFVIQETQAVKYLVILAIFFISKIISFRKMDWKSVAVIVGAITLAFMVWWMPMAIKYGGVYEIYSKGIRQDRGEVIENRASFHPSLQNVKYIGALGSGTIQHGVYTLKDIFFAKGQNYINVPVGVGLILMLLIVLGFLYFIFINKKLFKDRENELFLLFTIIFVYLGCHGGTRWYIPIALFTFRFWLLFAIFGSLLAVLGVYFIFNFFKIKGNLRFVLIFMIVIGVWFTSGSQKYELNTAQWTPGGGWQSVDELKGYLWLQTLPVNTPVFEAGGWGESIGMDKYHCRWCGDEIPYRESMVNFSNDDIYNKLIQKKYEYLIIPQKAVNQWGANETNQLLQRLSKDNRFEVAYQTPGFFAFKIT